MPSIRLTTQPTNNTELVVSLMEFSRYGGLCQMFLVEAIRTHAARVAQGKPEDFDNAMISGAAWVAVARDVKERCDAFYSGNRPPVTEPSGEPEDEDEDEDDTPAPQADPTEQERAEFRGYLRHLTDRQVQVVYEKERDAGRTVYRELAEAEAQRRGITLER